MNFPVLCCFALAILSTSSRAQTPPVPPPPAQQTPAAAAASARAGRPVTNQELSDAIRRSGLSQDQLKARLQSAGIDSGLADPFFGAATSVETARTGDVAAALGKLGLFEPEPTEAAAQGEQALNAEKQSNQYGGVFGKDIFRTGVTSFDPVAGGPVDPSYRLGVGDQLQVVLTGDVQQLYNAEIRRDGTVLLPQLGQVSLAGLTLDAARTVLRRRGGQFYSGLQSGQTLLDLSVSRVRTNAVFVIGEVESPGAHQVSALSTVFHAIAKAGGPTSQGSFRAIEVRRAGQVVSTIDLYEYLLDGNAASDIRTEQGDVIFVPLRTRSVAFLGEVRRPRIFELRGAEGFDELLRFGGGVLATASLERFQVDRVLPPGDRTPGRDRAIIDLEVRGRVNALSATPLYDGDIVTVKKIGDLRRNVVTIRGAVFQPGEYEWTNGMSLASLLEKAQGTAPWAQTDRIKLTRGVAATGRSEGYSLDLSVDSVGKFLLEEFDEVLVLDGRIAFPSGDVEVNGAVRRPGKFAFVDRLTIQDLVDLAGGTEEYAMADRIGVVRAVTATGQSEFVTVNLGEPGGGAFALRRGDRVLVLDSRSQFFGGQVAVMGAVVAPATHPFVSNETLKDAIDRVGGFLEEASVIEVARRRVSANYSDTTSELHDFSAQTDFELGGRAGSFKLERGDRITVRPSPGYRQQRFITLNGLFARPGPYAITENLDRISTMVERAGGLLPGAHLASFRLVRNGRPVAVDFSRALDRRDRREDVLVRPDDILFVGPDPGTVYVTGAVARPAYVLFDPRRTLRDYIDLAGGLRDNAARSGTIVEYPSGLSKRTRRILPSVYSDPAVLSGATITVPTRAESRISAGAVMDRTMQIASILSSLVVAVTLARR